MAARAHGGIEFSLVGTKALMAAMQALASRTPTIAAEALEVEADIELAASEPLVPELSGDLKDSGKRHPAVIADGDISVRITYGGPTVPYAVIQHEKLQYEHDDGEAKWLENTLRASRVFLLPRLGRRIGVDLAKP